MCIEENYIISNKVCLFNIILYCYCTVSYTHLDVYKRQDYNIVDKNGVVIPSADTTYSMVFPQAKQASDTIYIKLLNNPAPGVRKMEVQMLENKTDVFYVDIFSTAFRRPVTINEG